MKNTIIALLSLFTAFNLNAQSDFRIVVKTDNVGVSANNEFQFTGAAGNYDVAVYDETGTTLIDSLTGLSNAATIAPNGATPGIYELRVYAAATNGFNRIRFINGGDKLKLLEIRNWGDIQWSLMANAFLGCENLAGQAADTPDLSLSPSLENMFNGCTVFNQDIGNWDVSGVQNFSKMFSGCTAFNQDIGNWDVSSATNMFQMFTGATSFNQDIGNWDVSGVTNMNQLFLNCTAFNQDIGNWDVSSVTTMQQIFRGTPFDQDLSNWDVRNVGDMFEMFRFSALSTANYNQILVGWASLPSLQSNVSFHAGTAQYIPGIPEAARDKLVNTYNWTITDGGAAAAPNISGGAGIISVSTDPNTIAEIDTQDVRYDGMLAYDHAGKNLYLFDTAAAAGSNWKLIHSINNPSKIQTATDTVSGLIVQQIYEGEKCILTNAGAGIYLLTAPAGTYLHSVSILGDNTTLNASQELSFSFINAANSYTRRFSVQLYDANNDALVDQQATGTVHTQTLAGPPPGNNTNTGILIPGLNGFGSTGYYIELR